MRGPGDVAVIIPYLLGFQPAESLVLIALEGPRKRFGPLMRFDLEDATGPQAPALRQAVGVMVDGDVELVLVAAFSVLAERADPVVTAVLDDLAAKGIGVEEAFRADGSRWWSYLCHNPRCCTPAGTPYVAGTARVAAEAVMAGLAFAPDRDALRSQLAPDSPAIRSGVARAVARLDDGGLIRRWTEPGAIEAAVRSGLVRPGDLSADEVAALAVAVQVPELAVRAMLLLERETAAAHFELWCVVTRRVDDKLLPLVGCVAGLAAWVNGHGVLASHAVDRVLAVAPDHRLALIVAQLLNRAVNPRAWADIVATMRTEGGFPPSVA